MKTLLAFLLLSASAIAGEISLTFTVPDGTEQAYISKTAAAFGYTSQISTGSEKGVETLIDNPDTELQFLRKKLRELVVTTVREASVNKAVADAAATAKAAAETASKASADKITVK